MKNNIKQFQRYLKAETVSENTLYSYCLSVSQFLDFVNKDVKDVTPSDYLSYTEHLQEVVKAKPATYNIKLMGIKKFIKFYQEVHGDILINPSLIKSVSPKNRKKFGLSKADLNKILSLNEINHFKDSRNKSIIHSLYSTGLRATELCNLTLGQVGIKDLKNEVSLDDINSKITVIGKGSKERTVIISDVARKSMADYLNQRRIIDTPDNVEKVYVANYNKKIKGLDRCSLNKIVKNRGGRVGVTVTPHILRHTFGVDLLNSPNVNIKEVAEMLGHSSITTTEKYVNPHKSQLLDKIEATLNKNM